MNLFEEFLQLTSKFETEKIEYALCGGLAMAVYTFPRATIDIDILIETKTLEKAKQVAKNVTEAKATCKASSEYFGPTIPAFKYASRENNRGQVYAFDINTLLLSKSLT